MERKYIRSFGRINSRSSGLDVVAEAKNSCPELFFNAEDTGLLLPEQSVFFEVGFGYGEHTLHQAKLNPNSKIIGCETYTAGVANLIEAIGEEGIDNILIHQGDARLLLESMPDGVLDRIFVLFPDPWPKNKHAKRRIIAPEFLNLAATKLKSGGRFFFASDIEDYIRWTLAHFDAHESFGRALESSDLRDYGTPPDWWVTTRYQQKALDEGRSAWFLEFIRE